MAFKMRAEFTFQSHLQRFLFVYFTTKRVFFLRKDFLNYLTSCLKALE